MAAKRKADDVNLKGSSRNCTEPFRLPSIVIDGRHVRFLMMGENSLFYISENLLQACAVCFTKCMRITTNYDGCTHNCYHDSKLTLLITSKYKSIFASYFKFSYSSVYFKLQIATFIIL